LVHHKPKNREDDKILSQKRSTVISIFVALLLGFQIFSIATTADPPFGPNTRVSDVSLIPDNENKWWPSIATDNEGNIFIVWDDQRDWYSDIYFSKSTDGGNTFSLDKKISDDLTKYSQLRPAIAVDDEGSIYVVWIDRRNSNYDVYFTNSTDGGNTFSENKKVNDVDIKVGYGTPAIAAYGSGNILIAWEDVRDDANGDIYFANSTDGGYTFSPNKKVNDDGIGNTQEDPSIAVDNNEKIYIAWSDDRDGDDDIYISNSTDGGNSFSPNVKINNETSSTWHREPSLAVDAAGVIYVTWAKSISGDSNISFSYSTDGGNTFSENKTVNDDTSGMTQWHPCLTVGDSGDIFIVWEDSRDSSNDIYFANSTDSGNTFSPNKKINDDVGTNPQWKPCISAFGVKTIYIAWEDNRINERDIYFTNSTDSGGTFSPNKKVNDGIRNAWRYQTSTAVDDEGNIYVVWADDRNGDWDIYFANSTDGGNTFSENKRVNDDIGNEDQKNPKIAVDSKGDIYIVWEDLRSAATIDIYFAKSTDGGNTFSTNKRIDDDVSNAGQIVPSIAVDDIDNIYIVWEDFRNLMSDIYFSNSIDGGNTFSPNKMVNDFSDFDIRSWPSVAASGNGNIYVTWSDERNGNLDIYFSSSSDGGNTFSSDKKVSDDLIGTDKWVPSVAVDDAGGLFIAWIDYRNGDLDVYMANSTDGGSTFSADKKVNDDTGSAYQDLVSIKADDVGNIYFIWLDYRNGEEDIYFTKSIDGGNSFSPNLRVNDDVIPIYQTTPSIALDNKSNVYVAWADNREGCHHIYFSTTLFSVYDIHVIDITYNSATIIWKSNRPSNSTVEYGFSLDYSLTIDNNTEVMIHLMNLTDLDPGRLYHFRVTSYNDSDNISISRDFTFTTLFPIYLEPGWNLISIPLNQTNFDLKDVLKTIEGEYDAVQWFDLSDSNDFWKHYSTRKILTGLNDLADINRHMGIWIHITNPMGTTLYIDGTAPEIGYVNQITLQEGWNHVGYPSLITRTPPFDLPVNVDMVMYYNASSGLWERWDFGPESPDNLIEMRPGKGLLIHYTGVPTVWLLEYVN
jgi:hypothetical protein